MRHDPRRICAGDAGRDAPRGVSEFLKEYGLWQNRLAKAIGIPPNGSAEIS
jgi:hypothetical protein